MDLNTQITDTAVTLSEELSSLDRRTKAGITADGRVVGTWPYTETGHVGRDGVLYEIHGGHTSPRAIQDHLDGAKLEGETPAQRNAPGVTTTEHVTAVAHERMLVLRGVMYRTGKSLEATEADLARYRKEQAEAIRSAFEAGMTGPAIADLTGLTAARVYQIRDGKR